MLDQVESVIALGHTSSKGCRVWENLKPNHSCRVDTHPYCQPYSPRQHAHLTEKAKTTPAGGEKGYSLHKLNPFVSNTFIHPATWKCVILGDPSRYDRGRGQTGIHVRNGALALKLTCY